MQMSVCVAIAQEKLTTISCGLDSAAALASTLARFPSDVGRFHVGADSKRHRFASVPTCKTPVPSLNDALLRGTAIAEVPRCARLVIRGRPRRHLACRLAEST